MKEVDKVIEMSDFKVYISDLGGPSANMYGLKGKVQSICDRCVSPSCIHPLVCDNLDTDHSAMTQIYKEVDAHPKIKKAFVGVGFFMIFWSKVITKKSMIVLILIWNKS